METNMWALVVLTVTGVLLLLGPLSGKSLELYQLAANGRKLGEMLMRKE